MDGIKVGEIREEQIIQLHLWTILVNQQEKYGKTAFNLNMHQQIFTEGLYVSGTRVRKVKKRKTFFLCGIYILEEGVAQKSRSNTVSSVPRVETVEHLMRRSLGVRSLLL